MRAEKYRAYEEYMRSCMRDSAHDEGHIRRVEGAVRLLAQKEKNVDMDVLIAAALLHDIGREEQFRTGESHAAIGARMVKAYLIEQGESEDFAAHVSACIRTHSFRQNDPPASMEAKLLYDADKLDVVGAIGMARTFLYQGRMGEPIYSVGPDGAVLGGDERTPSFFNEYRRKLQNMGTRFLTAEGRRRAKQRSEAAARFVEALRAEVAAGESGSGWRLLPKTATARQRRIFNIAQMVAEGSGKASREEIAALVLQGGGYAEHGLAGRAVMDAEALDDLGALGAAQRLMEIGRMREDMDRIFEELPVPELYTNQARGMAKARRAAAESFIHDLRGECGEYREMAEAPIGGAME